MVSLEEFTRSLEQHLLSAVPILEGWESKMLDEIKEKAERELRRAEDVVAETEEGRYQCWRFEVAKGLLLQKQASVLATNGNGFTDAVPVLRACVDMADVFVRELARKGSVTHVEQLGRGYGAAEAEDSGAGGGERPTGYDRGELW